MATDAAASDEGGRRVVEAFKLGKGSVHVAPGLVQRLFLPLLDGTLLWPGTYSNNLSSITEYLRVLCSPFSITIDASPYPICEVKVTFCGSIVQPERAVSPFQFSNKLLFIRSVALRSALKRPNDSAIVICFIHCCLALRTNRKIRE